MNLNRINLRAQAVGTAISTVSSQVTQCGDSSWQFTLPNGAPHVVSANINDDWLVFDTDSGGQLQSPDSFWDALVSNGSLAGLAKLVATRDGNVRLRAELPLLEGLELTQRVQETCRGFEAEWTQKIDPLSPEVSQVEEEISQQTFVRCAPEPGSATVSAATFWNTPAGRQRSQASVEEDVAIDLKNPCSEAGWPFVERGGHKLAVELEVPGGFFQALLVPAGQGVRVQCEVATVEATAPQCRRAIAGFLLTASGLIRMGRASINPKGTSPVAQFEVVLGTAPSPLEISSALECLSVACSNFSEEIKMLQTPDIAERYLALRGWNGKPTIRPNERTATL